MKTKKPKPIRAFRVVAADCCAPAKNGDNCYPCAVIDASEPEKLIEQVATVLNAQTSDFIGDKAPISGFEREVSRKVLICLGLIPNTTRRFATDELRPTF